MTSGEKIKDLRKNSGMSQEKLAELVGVSRQAVAKWEAGKSSPATDNLFRLAEIFGTTTEYIVSAGDIYGDYGDIPGDNSGDICGENTKNQSPSAPEENNRKKYNIRKNMISALYVLLAYMAVYIIGRLIWCRDGSSFTGLLWASSPRGENSYLYGWLLDRGLFAASAVISMVPAIFGRVRFSAVTFAGFILGLLLGTVFGPNPEGAFYGQSHYGWAIWGGIFILSLAAGVVFEAMGRKAKGISRKRDRDR